MTEDEAEVRRLRALLDAGFLDATKGVQDDATRALLLSPEGREWLIREADRLLGRAP